MTWSKIEDRELEGYEHSSPNIKIHQISLSRNNEGWIQFDFLTAEEAAQFKTFMKGKAYSPTFVGDWCGEYDYGRDYKKIRINFLGSTYSQCTMEEEKVACLWSFLEKLFVDLIIFEPLLEEKRVDFIKDFFRVLNIPFMLVPNMDDKQKKILGNLLTQDKAEDKTTSQVIWDPNVTYQTSDKEGNIVSFFLSHQIIWQKRTNHKDGLRFHVRATDILSLNGEVIGKGGCGSVFEILATIAIDADKNLTVSTQKPRVSKFFIKLKDVTSETLKETIKEEHQISSMIPYLHVKEPVFLTEAKKDKQFDRKYIAYMVMGKLPGQNLFDVLHDDELQKSTLTIIQRLEITLPLLITLNETFSKKGIIHKDIHECNILLDLRKKLVRAYYIDFGVSSLVNSPRILWVGAFFNVPPELYWNNEALSICIDVFAVARVLGMVWGGWDDSYLLEEAEKYLRDFGKELEYRGLFQKPDPIFFNMISQDIKELIRTTLVTMSRRDPQKRGTLEEAIASFIQIVQRIFEKSIQFKEDSSQYQYAEYLLKHFGEMVLVKAVKLGKLDMVKFLIPKGADIHYKTLLGQSALEAAREQQEHPEIAKYFAKLEADEQEEFLHAAGNNGLQTVKNYLARYEKYPEKINMFNSEGDNALNLAICDRNPAIVQALLSAPATDVNAVDNIGFTALMWAAYTGQVDIVNLLLQKKVDVTLKDYFQNSASEIALKQGYIDIAVLLERAENASSVQNYSPRMWAKPPPPELPRQMAEQKEVCALR